MEKLSEIQNELQKLIDKQKLPKEVMDLLLVVKGKVDINLLKQINNMEILDGDNFIELIRGVIFGIDFIIMREEGKGIVKINVKL